MKEQLITLAIQQAPSVIAGLKELFQKENPDAPVPTEVEIIQAFNSAFFSSLAVDEAWLAAHPADGSDSDEPTD